MDLLEFGLENRRSKSRVKRVLAKAALEFERVWADIVDWELKKKKYDCKPVDGEAMLARLKEQLGIKDE